MKLWLESMLAVLCAIGAAGASEPPVRDPAAVSPERLQQLIAKLGADRFKDRAQAAEELSRLGRAALPALKEAAANGKEPEVRKRAQALVEEIRGRDRPRDGLLTLVSRLQQVKPPPSDRQLAVAIHLLSLSRSATAAEIDAAEKSLKGAKDRAARAEEVMWALLTGREFNDKLADLNLRVLDIKQKLTGLTLAEMLAKTNSGEFQKSLTDLSTRLRAATAKRSDEQLLDTLFLVFLARFPDEKTTTTALAHMKKPGNREQGLADVVWAVVNTKEFLLGK